ncbi:unnamed protein product, partial [Diamesa serratosioi]
MSKHKKRKLYTPIDDEDKESNDEANKIEQISEILSTSCNSVLIQVSKDYDRNPIYEIAINKYLELSVQDDNLKNMKILYIGPSKSHVPEKFNDWKRKFNSSLIHSLADEISELKLIPESEKVLIFTTATKWETLTRNWRCSKETVQSIKLILIDDEHLLNDPYRGAALEVVLSRMKIINNELNINSTQQVRFLYFSLIIPNIEDIVKWLESKDKPTVKLFTINESFCPTKVDKSVFGYPSIKMTSFRFDISLNYKLVNVIKQNSRNKPTLVFCSSRKSIELLTVVVENNLPQLFGKNGHGKDFHEVAMKIRDEKLKKLLPKGIAFYHGGLSIQDRTLLEKIFRDGLLPVLISTTILATEVNLPAYLVIIKGTQFYRNGANEEYDDNTIHQMMSRAGCPNSDNVGRVIIMTQEENVDKYRKLIANNLAVESNLHVHLTEHLNTEIVLKTITNFTTAIEWISTTFLHIRLHKNPKMYGLSMESQEEIDEKLKDIIRNFFIELEKNGLLTKNSEGILTATNAGILMALQCLSLKSIQTFQQITGNDSVGDLLNLLCTCQEFKEFSFRANDKKLLNELNQNIAKGLRYPMQGRIKSIEMKISCLIQASLGNVPINDFTLEQEQEKIMIIAKWLCQCIFEFISTLEKDVGLYRVMLSIVTLRKCLEANLWENSRLVIKQIGEIGFKEADTLAAAGLNSWDKVADYKNILTDIPSFFTNDLNDFVLKLPKYSIEIQKILKELKLNVKVKQLNDNWQKKEEKDDLILIVGDSKNKLLMFNDKLNQHLYEESEFTECIICKRDSRVIFINLVHSSFVGLDLIKTVEMEDSPVKEEQKENQSESNEQTTIKQTPEPVENKINIEFTIENIAQEKTVKKTISLTDYRKKRATAIDSTIAPGFLDKEEVEQKVLLSIPFSKLIQNGPIKRINGVDDHGKKPSPTQKSLSKEEFEKLIQLKYPQKLIQANNFKRSAEQLENYPVEKKLKLSTSEIASTYQPVLSPKKTTSAVVFKQKYFPKSPQLAAPKKSTIKLAPTHVSKSAQPAVPKKTTELTP